MRGRLVDLSLGLNRKQRITVEIDQDFRTKFDELKDTAVDVEIKKHRERRSLDANAYFWVLAGKLSAKIGIPPEEIYRQYIPDVGGNYEFAPVREDMISWWDRHWRRNHVGRRTEDIGPCWNTPGYHNVRFYQSSSDYDTAQMSRLIDLIVFDCKEQGIETLTPDKLSAMKERWGNAPGDETHGDPE